MTATVTIQGTVGPLAGGETKEIAGQLTSTATIGQLTDVVLASGDTTIAVPAGAVGVLIDPPTGNLVLLKLKGNAADVGIALHPTNPTLLSLDPTQTTLILNAASLTLAATQINFF